MIRKFVKKNSSNKKIDALITKYKIPRAYLSINRKSVTKALAIGLFIAMIPMPLQMAAVLLFIPFMKFNVPFAISLVWITNPFTMPFIYFIEYKTGSFLLMSEGIENIAMTMQWFKTHFDDILVPLYVGALFYSTLFASIAYYGVNLLWMRSVCKENKIRGKLSLKERLFHTNDEECKF